MATNILKKIWPEWTLGKRIGSGSYGVVYEAVRSEYGVENHAAIKVISIPSSEAEVDSLRSEGLDENATKTHFENIVQDFVNEIRVMVSLDGRPNIVNVKDYKVVEKEGEFGWHIFILMELLTPFAVYTCDKTLTEKEVIKLGCDICTALETCEQENIIHRDIKPGNILVHSKSGEFKLGDFGIARKFEWLTGGLSSRCTPKYMAPEVATRTDYDLRVDIYSLGIVLYQLLNGMRIPFQEKKQINSLMDIDHAVKRRNNGERLFAPSDASPAMANVILRACAFDPDMRFASATEMKKALMDVANGTYRPVAIVNPDKTTSVRKAARNPEQTVSVRKAPASKQKAGQSAGAFGTTPTKKSKLAVAIAVVLTVALVVAGIITVPKLINSNDNNDSNDTISGEVNYSKLHEEQIAAIVTEAESLAANENYESALAKVTTGMMTYPNSEVLKEKTEEYTDLLNAQIKSSTLLEAESLAASGDYTAAMDLIKNAQDTHGSDVEYQSAYDKYNQAYQDQIKSDALLEAEKLAGEGKYVDAIATIENAVVQIGEDAECSQKIDEYEANYVDSIIKSANSFVANEEYDEAEKILKDALRERPNNEDLNSRLKEIEATKPISITTLTALNVESWKWNDGIPADPFGNTYSNGCNYAIVSNGNHLDGHSIEYRLDGRYSKIKGTLAPYTSIAQDGYTYFQIFADDVLAYTSPVVSRKTDAINFDVDIFGANYLKLKVYAHWGSSIIVSDVRLVASGVSENFNNGIGDGSETGNSNTPVSITKLSAINSVGWKWDAGAPKDLSNSDYSTVCNYAIVANSNHLDGHSIEYRLDEQYTQLRGTFAPYTDISADGYGYFQVFADDVLVYTSPNITQKTNMKNFDLDVSGAQYIRIECYVHWYSSIILADITLQ